MKTVKKTIRLFLKTVGIIALGLSAAMLLVAAITQFGASILNLIGVTSAPFNIGAASVTGFAQLLFAILIDGALVALAAICRKGIKWLIRWV